MDLVNLTIAAGAGIHWPPDRDQGLLADHAVLSPTSNPSEKSELRAGNSCRELTGQCGWLVTMARDGTAVQPVAPDSTASANALANGSRAR